MKKYMRSDSSIQREIESYIFKELCYVLGVNSIVSNTKIPMGNDGKTYICPDFYSEKDSVIAKYDQL